MRAKQIILAMSMALSVSTAFATSQGELMTDLNSDIDVLEAQVKRDELRLKRQKIKAEMEKTSGGHEATDFQVVWVEGVGNKQYAQLISETGNRYEVRVGDKLPNGLKIVQIAPHEVVVEDTAKRRKMLSTAPATASVYQGSSPVMPGMGMPMIPPAPVTAPAMPVR